VGSAGANTGATPQASGSGDKVAPGGARQSETVRAQAAVEYANPANSGNNTLIKNRLLIREAKCFDLIR
jgi:hypothetical protein